MELSAEGFDRGYQRYTLEKLKKNLAERFRDNIKCLILYGSWAKGTARQDSDMICYPSLPRQTRKLESL